MKQVLHIGGGEAFSQYEDFLQYLKTKEIDLQKEKIDLWPSSLPEALGENYQCIFPSMPNTKNAKYDEWKIWFERHLEFVESGFVLIGWSLGAMFLIKYLTENEIAVRPGGLFLVAPAVMDTPEAVNESGEDGGDFVFDTSKMVKVGTQAERIHVFHSTDDYIVPHSHSEQFVAAVPAAKLLSFDDRNHFIQPEFPELIDLIKKL